MVRFYKVLYTGCEKGKVDPMAEKEMKLEESFDQLNHILEELEKPEITLEASFSLYQEGMKLLKSCNDSIDKVEKELIVLSENGEANEL
ncbi:MAG: hypothetical protein H6Q59_2922 [Firmicutes bacterium]|nr:hypothetical protein [Bacillota bacterium]